MSQKKAKPVLPPAKPAASEASTITMPAGQALQALQTLQRLGSAPLAARDAFAIARATARLLAVPEIVATEAARMAAVRSHGKQVGENYTVPPECMEAFVAEFQPIALRPVRLSGIRIPLSALEAAPAITPAEMMVLDPLLDED